MHRLIDMISTPSNALDCQNHLFVTPYKQVYDAFNKYGNVIYIKDALNKRGVKAEIVNSLAPYCDWIFLHCGLGAREMIKIKHDTRQKIIWRTWGHEIDVHYYSGHAVRNFFKKTIMRPMFIKTVQHFKAVGIANAVDQLIVCDQFGPNVPVKTLDYPSIVRIDGLKPKRLFQDEQSINILIGHNGAESENHIALMESFRKRSYFEKLRIYLPVSYSGAQTYIEKLKHYATVFPNVNLIESFMPMKAYMDFINTMDIVILDGKGSYALGNLAIFLFLRKKIFLNRFGVIKRAFDLDKLPYNCTDEIETMSLDELTNLPTYPQTLNSSLSLKEYKDSVALWRECLDWLELSST